MYVCVCVCVWCMYVYIAVLVSSCAYTQGMWTNLSSGCYSDVDLVESLHHKSYHNFYHNFYPKAIVNCQSHYPKAIICGQLVRFVEN